MLSLTMSVLSSSVFIHNSNYGEMRFFFLDDNNEEFNFIDIKVTFVVIFHWRLLTVAPTFSFIDLITILEIKTNNKLPFAYFIQTEC